jgi:hypothetical protein
VLNNGNVLVIGGRNLSTSGAFYWNGIRANIGPVLASCEIYDPIANTWTYTGAMTYARFLHRAVLLPDGRVLVVGGLGYNPTQPQTPIDLQACEVYDPVSGNWGPCGSLQYPRDTVTATYIPDKNQVIVTGGTDPVGGLKTEVFDVARNRWSLGTASWPRLQIGTRAALLGTDCVAVIGGTNTGSSSNYLNIYVPNSDTFMGGGLNGQFTIAAVGSPTTFQYLTNEQQYTLNGSTTATVTAVAAQASDLPGPYIIDPEAGLTITSIASPLTATINANNRYASVSVANANLFPDEPGYLVFDFGYKDQVAPVKYFGRLSSTQLSIDYSFKFPNSVQAGAQVTYLAQKGPFNPDNMPDLGGFYLTDSPAGRAAAQDAIAATVAAGINTTTTIAYPGDRGLGNEGQPTHGQNKLSDIVWVFAGEDPDAEIAADREE